MFAARKTQGSCTCGKAVETGMYIVWEHATYSAVGCEACNEGCQKKAAREKAPVIKMTFHTDRRARFSKPDFSIYGAKVIEVPENAIVRSGSQISVLGADLMPDEEMTALGALLVGKFGPELKISSIIQDVGSAAGFERFLTKLPGIGEERAKLLLQACGGVEKAKQVLTDGNIDKLTDIPGITKDAADSIVKEYSIIQEFEEVYSFFFQHGATDSVVAAALKAWGKNAAARAEEDPYELMTLPGIGWERADAFGRALGIIGDDPRRAIGLARHIVAEIGDKGHTWMPLAAATGRSRCDFGKWVAKHGLKDPVLTKAFETLAEDETPLVEVDDLNVGVTKLIEAEEAIAFDIARLQSAAMVHGTPSAEAVAAACRPFIKDDGTESPLDAAQITGIEMVAAHPVVVLTGGPGRGKTAIVQRALEVFEAMGLNVALCAPTGKAAIRMSEQCDGRAASTIHRLLKFHPEFGFRHNSRSEVLTEEGKWLTNGRLDMEGIEVIIVDEVSMVDVELGHALLDAAPDGCRVVFVGDVDQLPSIGAGRVLNDVIRSEKVPTTRLTKIFRQAADSGIPYAAEAINTGTTPDWDNLGGVSFEDVGGGDESVADCLHAVLEQVCKVLPAEGIMPRDVQVLCPQKKKGVGVENLNVALKVRLNPSDYSPTPIGNSYEVHAGDRVIHTKNDYDLEVFNGEIGVVTAAGPGGLPKVPTGTHYTNKYTKKNPITVIVDYGDKVIGYTAVEARQLHLAYAVTGHKFQGSQSKAVVVVAHSVHAWTLTRAWVYTALTRAADRLVVVGQQSAVAKAANNLSGTERNTTLAACMG